jgi:rRNA processing protein Krr1/Pno1
MIQDNTVSILGWIQYEKINMVIEMVMDSALGRSKRKEIKDVLLCDIW